MKDEATPEQLAMARRIASKTKTGAHMSDFKAGVWDNSPVVQAALTAIIETQRLDAGLAETATVTFRSLATYTEDVRRSIATAIRAGKHYGKDTDQ